MMRQKAYTLLLLLVLLLPGGTVCAQHPKEHPGMRLEYGLDPRADSIAVSRIRSRMDGIRKRRPTVALVLSGGGAKGAAHIGVIRYLESVGLPVDIVLGTSMGGLVGGLYALGYDSAAMDTVIRNINWNSAMTDAIPREYISYAESKYKEKFFLSFPFYYSEKDFLASRQMDEELAGVEHRYDKLRLGAGAEDATSLVKDNLLGSLPSGFIFGQNVSNIISALTVGYQDPVVFGELPVPFVCVATEMVTAKPKIWYSGKLNTALRSTMSIPGVFAPVKTAGMVLVDGGMRNNFPCDLAREMGADIVIGVDLSSGYKKYSGINNIADIISQGIDMFGRESYEKNVAIPDVTIKPYLPEYNMMSFDDASIATIIDRGYRAALEQADTLWAIKERIGEESLTLQSRKAVNINNEAVDISGIEITGVSDNESQYLMRKIGMHVAHPVDRAEIEDAVATIYGTKAFDYVTYELVGEEAPYRLRINCKKGPIHQVGIGARFDTEEIVSVLLNLGINVHSLQGSALDITGKVGTNPYLGLRYYYNSPSGPTVNLGGSLRWTDRNQFNIGSSNFKAAYLNLREDAYLSNINWYNFDVQGGIRSDYYRINSIMADKVIGDYDLGSLKNNYFSFFLKGIADTFDDGYFPESGFSVGLDYSWVFGAVPDKIHGFHAIQTRAKGVVPFTDRFSVLPAFYSRFLFGEDVPLPYVNVIGGSLPGRYLDQQIPFIGINNAAALGNLVMVLRADFRYKVFKNNYVTGVFNFAETANSMKDYFGPGLTRNSILGLGVEYAYYSIIGPVSFNLHWSSLTHRVGAYLGVGFDF